MYLSKINVQKIPSFPGLEVPDANVFSRPERVLQFGTGVLLRALPDFIIDKANKKSFFNGRIVMVKSTGTGDTDAFNKQDGLYTVCIRGIDKGKKVVENCIISSISRVLSASSEWNAVLETAANPQMQVIISNTTEVGITLIKDNVHATPPQSFPGKLLSFLYQRFKIFNGDATKGMVVIPTELIPGNADKLLAIVKELAHQNDLETSFFDWLENANYFCNSLVDRIVPGKPPLAEQEKIEDSLGYKDELMIISEAYALWAIQSNNEKVKEILSFASEEEGVVIAGDISKFRELKLRLLNGPHTFSCGLAWLAGFKTVKDAMVDEHFSGYIQQLMFDEIIPAITGDTIHKNEAEIFAAKVLDRFRNNFINHQWLSICLQYSSKMRLRNIDVIINYIHRLDKIPSHMAMGMAAHILFMKITPAPDGKFYGEFNRNQYQVEDQNAALYADYWKNCPVKSLVNKILDNEQLWGIDFSTLNGFEAQVSYWLQLMIDKGVTHALQQHDNNVRVQ
jgi:tagaturonate reductase